MIDPNAGSALSKAPAPLRLAASSLAVDIEFLFARATSLGAANANRRLSELGLRVRSYSVLSLACSDVRPSQREVAEFLNLDPSQIVSLVDDLESRGLVAREPDARDRRNKVIVATSQGRTVNEQAIELTKRASDESLAALSTEEREQLKALLSKIAYG